jgi:hypothetical protein
MINKTMDDKKDKDVSSNSLESMGLSVQYGKVEVGQTYPIYGTITSFINEVPGSVVVMINQNIELSLNVNDDEKLSLLKSRIFEPGIFITKINNIGEIVKGECSTIVFGTKQSTDLLH